MKSFGLLQEDARSWDKSIRKIKGAEVIQEQKVAVAILCFHIKVTRFHKT